MSGKFRTFRRRQSHARHYAHGSGDWMRGGYAAWGRNSEYTIAPWIKPDFARRMDLRGRALANLRSTYHACPQVELSVLLSSIQASHEGFSRLHLAAPSGMMMTHPFADRRALSMGLGIDLRVRPQPGGRQKPILAAAMRDILPECILNRPLKGHFNESYYIGLSRNLPYLEALVEQAPVDDLGFLDKASLLDCVQRAALGNARDATAMLHFEGDALAPPVDTATRDAAALPIEFAAAGACRRRGNGGPGLIGRKSLMTAAMTSALPQSSIETLSAPTWRMWAIFSVYRWRILPTYALFSLENLLRLAQPLVLGWAIDDLLRSSLWGLAIFFAQHGSYVALGVARRINDTRCFTRIQADLAARLVLDQRGCQVEVSTRGGPLGPVARDGRLFRARRGNRALCSLLGHRRARDAVLGGLGACAVVSRFAAASVPAQPVDGPSAHSQRPPQRPVGTRGGDHRARPAGRGARPFRGRSALAHQAFGP